jgi:hypothetical protein
MNFIFQSTRELMDEVFEVSLDTKNVGEKEASEELTASRPSGLTITCVPSKDEADEISGVMLAQVLRAAGHQAHALELGPVSTMLKELRTDIRGSDLRLGITSVRNRASQVIVQATTSTLSQGETYFGTVGLCRWS